MTGSAGRIGRAVGAELRSRGHHVRGFDRAPSPGLDDPVEGDLTDPADVARAMAGIEAVVHLAATPEQARRAGVGRIVRASTGQVVRGHAGPFPITPEPPPSSIGALPGRPRT